MAFVRRPSGPEVLFAGHSALNARAIPTAKMLLALEQEASAGQISETQTSLVQFDDYAHHDAPSVAFGRLVGAAPYVRLIPDTYFFESQGYAKTRAAAQSGVLPEWRVRQDLFFWRGSPTTNWFQHDGSPVTSIAEIPRVKFCGMLVGDARCDVGISNAWGDRFTELEMLSHFQVGGFHRPGIPMVQHARYKFLFDVDGVANAWSFFDKLLMGSCVLKIRSPYEQWYYSEIQEWVHFVPVERDLSNLIEILDWCSSHDGEAREIAERGQRYALSTSFASACSSARQAISDCALPGF